MDRRTFLKGTAALGAGLTLPWTEHLPFARAATGCRLGAYASPTSGQTGQTAIQQLERLIGRKLAITRHYRNWKDALPGTFIDWSAGGGRVPYVAWHSKPLTWSKVASGSEDAWIQKQARSIRSAGYPMYFAFHHEPENDTSLGNAADYVRAYTHVRKVFDSNGVTNLTWLVPLMASTYDGGHGGARSWLPASNVYDLLGVDGYNRFPCLPKRSFHPWASFADVFGSAHALSGALGKRLFVAECATVENDACGYNGDPLAKGNWISDARATAKRWTDLAAVLYSHTRASYLGYPEEFWVDTSNQSLNAFKSLAADSYFA